MRIDFPQRFLGTSSIARTRDGGVSAAVGIEAWLSRAKHLPLRLSVREDFDPQSRAAESSVVSDTLRHRVIITIGDFAGKLADVNIDVSLLSFRAFCLDSRGDTRSFPMLRSLSIGSSHSPWMEVWTTDTAHNLPLFSADTRLHSLALSTSYLPVNLLQVPMSLGHLTELTLTYRLETDSFRPSPLHVFQILLKCPNLRTCTLTLGEGPAALAFEPQRGRLELPSLRHLTIFDECPTTTLSLMSALYVPSLVRLRYGHYFGSVIDLPHNAADQPLLPIQSLQLRLDETSPSPLVGLTLQLTADSDDDEPDINEAILNYLAREGESIHDLDFKEASGGITELLSLSRGTGTDSDEFDVGATTPTSNASEVLCPNLQSIVWTTSGESTRNAFLEMLYQRCDANKTFTRCAQLRRAQLTIWELSPESMDEVEEKLKEIVALPTSDLRIEYELYCWTGHPCEGHVISKKGVVMSEPS
ncbi:hypothetical protein E1B28_007652 [Marasmius oreades]|uniref:Uncharacterized protein n=1 Tax=Marasmius oreades TaxID=181124 RepID=A0A9P7S2R5_9AGAR|nr:uncharacterized protein E1B28_007652 [Marasmius oreades]KAG7094030.1 hypothetical protein E1B28_007652 [Marasmius oreades]